MYTGDDTECFMFHGGAYDTIRGNKYCWNVRSGDFEFDWTRKVLADVGKSGRNNSPSGYASNLTNHHAKIRALVRGKSERGKYVDKLIFNERSNEKVICHSLVHPGAQINRALSLPTLVEY